MAAKTTSRDGDYCDYRPSPPPQRSSTLAAGRQDPQLVNQQSQHSVSLSPRVWQFFITSTAVNHACRVLGPTYTIAIYSSQAAGAKWLTDTEASQWHLSGDKSRENTPQDNQRRLLSPTTERCTGQPKPESPLWHHVPCRDKTPTPAVIRWSEYIVA